MKHSNFTLLLLLTGIFLMHACKKDTVTPPEDSTVTGYWLGKIGNANSLQMNYAVLLKKDGKMRAYNIDVIATDTTKALKGDGSWQRNGKEIKCFYSMDGHEYSTVGFSTENFSSMDGYWSSKDLFAGGFTLARQ